MPPLSLPKAPVEKSASGATSTAEGLKGPTGTGKSNVPPFPANAGTVGTAATSSTNGTGISADGGAGALPSGPALSLPALPKMTPPPRALLKPPVADLMSNSSHGSDGDDLVSAVSSVSKQAEMDVAPPKTLRPPPSLGDSPFPAPIFCGPVDHKETSIPKDSRPAAPRDLPSMKLPPKLAAQQAEEQVSANLDQKEQVSEVSVQDAPQVGSHGDIMVKEVKKSLQIASSKSDSPEERSVHLADEAEDSILEEFPRGNMVKASGFGDERDESAEARDSCGPLMEVPSSTPGPSASSVFFDAASNNEGSVHSAASGNDSDATVRDGCDLNRHAQDVAHWSADAPASINVPVEVEARRPRRQRVSTIPATARASDESSEEEIERVYRQINDRQRVVASLEDLRAYVGDYLGFGQAEVEHFFEEFSTSESPTPPGLSGLDRDSLQRGFGRLNPFQILNRKQEVIVRKPGSLHGQQVTLENLEDCEVYICETSAQVFVDCCKKTLILLGPCESSAFVRDCEDCTIWCAAQQLRTRECKRCKFYVYSKTAPIIEASYDLTLAPWCAKYPCAGGHFDSMRFDVTRNLWNAVFDFSGEKDRPHWQIAALEAIEELEVTLDGEGPAENLVPKVTHEMLCAPPLESEESAGQGLAIPQPKPPLPPRTEGPKKRSVVDKPVKRMPGIPSGPDQEIDDGWQCSRCTLKNAVSASSCMACGNLKTEQVASVWHCPSCTLENSRSLTTCAACGKPNRATPTQIAPAAGGLFGSSFSSVPSPQEPPQRNRSICSFLAEAIRPICMKSQEKSRT